ncbi:hypothetical protein HN018_23685 (plasmid) [Lichenicola cladoniae]|uniref:Uncharacterized protein n=1 Tax=Lichenicola cladoniae TaxID=1484109 RepID=A0A6M8HXB4_9PROT|nr:hypothetical protein [Lichenicola cladoniae]NPD66277.1 hypothetical protein [Acetobacteraceae bacterium]QKE93189.1 hypothetical protein HN018_23685 [Lichenicola cladoniae]
MTMMKYVILVTGSLLFGIACYAVLAAPGLLADEASTVSLHSQFATVRR